MKLEKYKSNGKLSTVVVIDNRGIAEIKNGKRIATIQFKDVKAVKLSAVAKNGRLNCTCKIRAGMSIISFSNIVMGNYDNDADLRYILALKSVHSGIYESGAKAKFVYDHGLLNRLIATFVPGRLKNKAKRAYCGKSIPMSMIPRRSASVQLYSKLIRGKKMMRSRMVVA